MPERDELASAFVELEAFVREQSRLPGLAAAQSEARRRRGRHVAWLAGVLVLVLASVSTVSFAWLGRSGPPVVEPSPSVTAGPTPSSSATPSPTITTGPVPATLLAAMTPPGRIRNAAIDVPAFDVAGCPSGRLQFLNASAETSGGGVLMEFAAVGDVDADGREDIIVALRCGPADGSHGIFSVQVLAYSGTELRLLGPISTGGLTMVSSLLVDRDGDVLLGMARTGEVQAIVHSRYRWTASEFALIDRVEVPSADLPEVAVSVNPATVELAAGGPAKAVTVSIRNDGPASAFPVELIVTWSAPVLVEVEGSANRGFASRHDLLIAAPEPGQTVTLVLRIALPTGVTLPEGSPVLVAAQGGRPGTGTTSATIPLFAA